MTEPQEEDSLKHLSHESGKTDESLSESHKEWVVAAIDQIRQRKNRPDFARLSFTLQRRHGLSKTKIQSIIDQLVEDKLIFKVFFKGQCSYRSAKSGFKHDTVRSLSTSNRITHGIRAIMKQTGDGVSFKDLENWLLGRNPETKLVKNRLEVALRKEMEANTITKLSDNCYVLTESLPTKEKKEEKPVVPTTTPKKSTPAEKTNGPIIGTRKVGRPKKKGMSEGAKKNDDPDYEVPYVCKPKKPEKVICDFCKKPAESKEGKRFLLICKDCNAKAHPLCMNYSEELAAKARNSPWQCIDCKVCCVCEGAGDDSSLLFCDACDKGYHMACHKPSVYNKPKGKWMCVRCKIEKKSPPNVKEKTATVVESPCEKNGENQANKTSDIIPKQEPGTVDLLVSRRGRKRKLKENFGDFVGFDYRRRSTTSSLNQSATTTSSFDQSANDQSVKETAQEEAQVNEFTDGTEGASCLPTPSASPTLGDTFDYQLKMSESVIPLHINDNSTYPNASKWTTDEVVNYFTEIGFSAEAKAFKEQEIDGKSLLLMKRNDVLTGLAIRLGPALKIYQKVYKLQTVGQLAS